MDMQNQTPEQIFQKLKEKNQRVIIATYSIFIVNLAFVILWTCINILSLYETNMKNVELGSRAILALIETFVASIFIYLSFYFYRMGINFVRILLGKQVRSFFKFHVLFISVALTQVYLFV